MFKQIISNGLIICAFLSIAGCEKKAAKPAAQFTVITVQPKSLVTPLHFSGTLEPLSTQSVLSPFEGRVTKVLFQYGQQLQKDQPLIVLDATKLAEDYRKTVSDFLEKKQSYETGLISYQGTEALYKAGVISKEEYSTATTSQQSNTLNYLQAKYDLEKLLAQTNISFASVEQLKLTDMNQVNQTLNRQLQEVKVVAPAPGVALFPPPDQKKEGSSGRINVGDDIKSGQLILSIGDLSGLTLKINVSEVSINLIKANLSAKVTGDAFPGMVLPGVVASVAAQANPQSIGSGNLGQFEVIVKIPKLTPAEQNIIHVGMSAAVELDIPEPPMIYLPIKAVYQKNGQTLVTLVTPAGKHQEVPVITGKTTLTEVAIIKGVSPGDRILVPS